MFTSATDVDAPGADEDDFMTFKRRMTKFDADEKIEKTKKTTTAPKRKVVTF